MEDERRTQAETWALYIPATIPKTVPGIVALGRLLIDAKAALRPGEFTRLFGEKLVPFGLRSAGFLMAIARHATLVNPAHEAQLPASWTILAYLTTVPADVLDAAVREARLTPTTSRAQALVLIRELRHRAHHPHAKPTVLQKYERLQRMREMAADGARSEQIAAEVHLHPQTCRALMRQAGIDCVADRVTGRSRRLNADRILDHMVASAAGIAEDIKLIDFAQLTRSRLPDYIASLKQSVKHIVQLTARLDARKERYVTTKKEHAVTKESA